MIRGHLECAKFEFTSQMRRRFSILRWNPAVTAVVCATIPSDGLLRGAGNGAEPYVSRMPSCKPKGGGGFNLFSGGRAPPREAARGAPQYVAPPPPYSPYSPAVSPYGDEPDDESMVHASAIACFQHPLLRSAFPTCIPHCLE